MDTTELATVQTTNYLASDYCTFDLSENVEMRKTVTNAVNNALSLSTVEGQSLAVVGAMTMPGTRRSRQQGVPDQPCTNVYLVCENGEAYFSQSEGVRRAVDTMLSMRLFDGEPHVMHLESKKLPNGNTLKTLVLD